MRSVVVLPAPLGPSSAVTWPSGAVKLTPSTARTSPKRLCRFSTRIIRLRLSLAFTRLRRTGGLSGCGIGTGGCDEDTADAPALRRSWCRGSSVVPASMNALIKRRPHPVPPAVWPVPGITMCFELGSVLAICLAPHRRRDRIDLARHDQRRDRRLHRLVEGCIDAAARPERAGLALHPHHVRPEQRAIGFLASPPRPGCAARLRRRSPTAACRRPCRGPPGRRHLPSAPARPGSRSARRVRSGPAAATPPAADTTSARTHSRGCVPSCGSRRARRCADAPRGPAADSSRAARRARGRGRRDWGTSRCTPVSAAQSAIRRSNARCTSRGKNSGRRMLVGATPSSTAVRTRSPCWRM